MDRILSLLAAGTLALGAGCVLAVDPVCDVDSNAVPLRDPARGVCVPDHVVDDTCREDGASSWRAALESQPDWASCLSPCEDLGERDCLAAAECRGIYVEDDAASPTFAACWGIAPSGPVSGPCDGLGAQSCSRHADCVAIHARGSGCTAGDCVGGFTRCEPEAAACLEDDHCPSGQHCRTDGVCRRAPGCVAGEPCTQVCWGECVASAR